MAKRIQMTFEFKDTEEQAIAFCESINRSLSSYRRKKYPAHYTPWQSSSPSDKARFVCWYPQ